MKTYRVGIIGLSWISIRRPDSFYRRDLGSMPIMSHVPAYQSDPRAEVVAVCDISERAIGQFRDEWGHELPNVRIYQEYRRMLETEDLDIVSVVTSDHLHAEMVVDAAHAGVRGILCEKPLATTLGDCDRMIAAVRNNRVVMSVNHTRRWMSEFVEAKHLIDSGRIGRLRHVIATMGGERALLFRNLTHSVDVIQFFVQSEPDWLVADLEEGYEAYGPRYAGDGGHDPATDPGCNAYITFKNGVRAYLAGMKQTVNDRTFEFVGENGLVRLSNSEATLWVRGGSGKLASEQIGRTHGNREWVGAAVSELIDAVESGHQKTSSPPEEARAAVAILLGILHSHHEGHHPISLDNLVDY